MRQSVNPGTAEQRKNDQRNSTTGGHQPERGSGMGCREDSECDSDRRNLVTKGAYRLRKKDPPKLWLTQKSKSRHCLDPKGSESSCRTNTPADASEATAVASRSELKSPVECPGSAHSRNRLHTPPAVANQAIHAARRRDHLRPFQPSKHRPTIATRLIILMAFSNDFVLLLFELHIEDKSGLPCFACYSPTSEAVTELLSVPVVRRFLRTTITAQAAAAARNSTVETVAMAESGCTIDSPDSA